MDKKDRIIFELNMETLDLSGALGMLLSTVFQDYYATVNNKGRVQASAKAAVKISYLQAITDWAMQYGPTDDQLLQGLLHQLRKWEDEHQPEPRED